MKFSSSMKIDNDVNNQTNQLQGQTQGAQIGDFTIDKDSLISSKKSDNQLNNKLVSDKFDKFVKNLKFNSNYQNML